MPSTVKCFSDDVKKGKSVATNVENPIVRSQYVPITEETATIILDVEEEREKLKSGGPAIDTKIDESADDDQFTGLNLEREFRSTFRRGFSFTSWLGAWAISAIIIIFLCSKSTGGIHGVFDIEDLVEVLKRDNAIDIFVSEVPSHLKYVDYICVITARSPRHMKAIAEFVRKMYKAKRSEKDLVPKLEGKGSTEWVALDLGNIALHIFTWETREKYDIEQLWSVGQEYDAESNKPDDEVTQMYERHSRYLADLYPAKKPGGMRQSLDNDK